MSAQQQMVGAAGVALVVVNAWTRDRDTLKTITGTAGAAVSTANTQQENQRVLKNIGIQVLAVGVLTLIAGTSRAVGNGMLAVIVGLWILWALRGGAGNTSRSTGAGTSGTGGPNRRI